MDDLSFWNLMKLCEIPFKINEIRGFYMKHILCVAVTVRMQEVVLSQGTNSLHSEILFFCNPVLKEQLMGFTQYSVVFNSIHRLRGTE